MTKYLLSRLLRGILSVIAVVLLVMILVYSLVDRADIFGNDATYTKKQNNEREIYRYQRWEDYGYLDYVPFSEHLDGQVRAGALDQETALRLANLGYTAEDDDAEVAAAVQAFTQQYQSRGYTVVRLDAMRQNSTTLKKGGAQALFAYKDKPLVSRLWSFFSGLIHVENIHDTEDVIGERGITFTLYDPVYNPNGEKTHFSPAILGNGTEHKYLLYFDGQFPFIHQNLISLHLGASYSVNTGVDVFKTMTQSQGTIVPSAVTWPTGKTEEVSYDLHSATYSANTFSSGRSFYTSRFTDDYTTFETVKSSYSKVGFSFIIGLIAVFLSYVIGVPLGVAMARSKDKLGDKLGTIYIVFIIAVPSLAYIFMFRAIGKSIGLPTSFDIDSASALMYILPIVSLALPSIGNLMKWVRRYMIDQLNSDYVKFARAGGLSEGEIFRGHILKNAIIPIVHGIPGAVFGALAGAIITESVYSVPGAGGMLVKAINYYDNGAIVGLTMFYATLSVVSLILGDILMALVDPRISYTSKAR